jgi:hypothetical protein
MPALPLMWMDSTRWQSEPLGWASYSSIYNLIAPQVSVRGRMALVLFIAVAWAVSWYTLSPVGLLFVLTGTT